MKEHYNGSQSQERIEAQAKAVDALMSPVSAVLHINETGKVMQDVLSSSIRTGQTDLVQRYARYHALTIVRWLAGIFSDLARSACAAHKIDAFFGVWEYFQTYTVDDGVLKSRKVWPLKYS